MPSQTRSRATSDRPRTTVTLGRRVNQGDRNGWGRASDCIGRATIKPGGGSLLPQASTTAAYRLFRETHRRRDRLDELLVARLHRRDPAERDRAQRRVAVLVDAEAAKD